MWFLAEPFLLQGIWGSCRRKQFPSFSAWSARLVRLVQGHGRAGRIGLEARFDVESGKSGSKFQEFRVIRRNARIMLTLEIPKAWVLQMTPFLGQKVFANWNQRSSMCWPIGTFSPWHVQFPLAWYDTNTYKPRKRSCFPSQNPQAESSDFARQAYGSCSWCHCDLVQSRKTLHQSKCLKFPGATIQDVRLGEDHFPITGNSAQP